MSDDNKPTMSLATERKERERDFAQERAGMIKELADIGQSLERARAIADAMLLTDWYVLQATVILERWDLEQNAEAAVRLVEIMARSIRRSRLWQRWGEGHGKCWGDHRLARADPQLPLIELLPLRSAPLLELPNYNCSN